MRNICQLLVLSLLLLTAFSSSAQMQIHQKLYAAYPTFKEVGISQRRFDLGHLQAPLHKLETLAPAFTVEKRGKSAEGRDIFLVKTGTGESSVLLWSQMHGDEATATAALLDVFNFLSAQGDEFDTVRKTILTNTSLYFLPMLNPDGAARFQRRNALGIDLNRDALRLASPESRVLKQVRDSLKADWGFNLHDQNRRYAAGPKGNVASITLLAPPVDDRNTVNAIRRDAMQLVVDLHTLLQDFIPNGIGRWNDEFEARAFGENMQIWGTRTVLIESGGYGTDWEKQEVRRLNFVAILAGLHKIATAEYQKADLSKYAKIPENNRRFFDLLIRNAEIKTSTFAYQTDIGIDYQEEELPEYRYYNEATIEDWGDLSTFQGFTEFDATGLQASAGAIAPERVKHLSDITAQHVKNWLKAGYTGVVVNKLPSELTHSPFPINLYAQPPKLALGFEEDADLVLKKNSTVTHVVINGCLIAVAGENAITGQGRVIR